MSAPHEPAKPSPGPSGGRTAATFLLILVGVGLLLPGLCSLAVIVILLGIEPRSVFEEGSLVAMWALSFAAGLAGILLIRHAIRRNRNRTSG